MSIQKKLAKMTPLVLALIGLSSFTVACDQAPEMAAETDELVLQERTEELRGTKPSIVLVHGAFADGSGFQYVVPLLQAAGYQVSAVQNPLTSVADDVATTQRVLDAQPGHVLLVGHSYGGVVISAAANHPKVKGLVYIAAYAPDDGEVLGELTTRFGKPEVNAALVPDSAGFLSIAPERYPELFAGDLFLPLARGMAVAQRPVHATIFDQHITHAAWHDLPSWYVVARKDRIIHPNLERFMAKRMGAVTTELDASHVPFVSRPLQISKIILDAARVVAQQP